MRDHSSTLTWTMGFVIHFVCLMHVRHWCAGNEFILSKSLAPCVQVVVLLNLLANLYVGQCTEFCTIALNFLLYYLESFPISSVVWFACDIIQLWTYSVAQYTIPVIIFAEVGVLMNVEVLGPPRSTTSKPTISISIGFAIWSALTCRCINHPVQESDHVQQLFFYSCKHLCWHEDA